MVLKLFSCQGPSNVFFHGLPRNILSFVAGTAYNNSKILFIIKNRREKRRHTIFEENLLTHNSSQRIVSFQNIDCLFSNNPNDHWGSPDPTLRNTAQKDKPYYKTVVYFLVIIYCSSSFRRQTTLLDKQNPTLQVTASQPVARKII